MAKSLFQKATAEKAPSSPYDKIESEIAHLKKGTSVRHGNKPRPRTPPWLVLLALFTLAWLYLMDPPMHAWYKGEAVHTVLYLHNYSAGPLADRLIATQILAPDEIETLNRRTGAFQGYYASPEAANKEATKIIDYMDGVRLLHAGKYEKLDPLGRMRYLLFIRTGLILPTRWDFLDPGVGN
jgi:hypothetical protein